MKILVTGGAGFIGSNLVTHIANHSDHQILNIDSLTYAGNLDSLAAISGNSNYQFSHTDICDPAELQKLFADFKPDSVMHLAAESHVDRSIDGPGKFIETNIHGTYTLLQVARAYFEGMDESKKSRFRFLHVSTDEVYGSLGFKDPAFSETTAYDPHSPYSASKAASDHLVRAWHSTYHFPTLITNCSNNYGPYQFPEKLVPVVILNALHGRTIPVYGKGENIRDWLYVEDHAKALLRVVEDGKIGETYNIGGNNERSNLDLVKMICQLMDEQLPPSQNKTLEKQVDSYSDLIEFVTDRPGHDLRYAINSQKIQSDLGWTPEEDISSGFLKTVEWYLENQEWWGRILSGEYQLERQGLST